RRAIAPSMEYVRARRGVAARVNAVLAFTVILTRLNELRARRLPVARLLQPSRKEIVGAFALLLTLPVGGADPRGSLSWRRVGSIRGRRDLSSEKLLNRLDRVAELGKELACIDVRFVFRLSWALSNRPASMGFVDARLMPEILMRPLVREQERHDVGIL